MHAESCSNHCGDAYCPTPLTWLPQAPQIKSILEFIPVCFLAFRTFVSHCLSTFQTLFHALKLTLHPSHHLTPSQHHQLNWLHTHICISSAWLSWLCLLLPTWILSCSSVFSKPLSIITIWCCQCILGAVWPSQYIITTCPRFVYVVPNLPLNQSNFKNVWHCFSIYFSSRSLRFQIQLLASLSLSDHDDRTSIIQHYFTEM